MLFNSYAFLLLFLPITVAGFFALGRLSRSAAAAWLAVASLFFYGWWDARFVALLLVSIGGNFFAGKMLHGWHAAGRTAAVRRLLAAAVAANLALLGYFKYANFFLSSVEAVFDVRLGMLDVLLPLGISFFTFTQIAFLVDTARGEAKEYSFIHYVLFVTYFPHLIAGPILHHREMMPQFSAPATYRLRAEYLAIGVAYLAVGLFKKCVIADSFAPDATAIFGAAAKGALLSAPTVWKGALAYTLQLYFDFSGYSDMAIGLARMIGVRLPFNFDSPYRATSVIEFWRRWHMTLSRFLRDYLYFPLGGNRKGSPRRYVNLMTTMVLGGLWHGANWTFALWGGLHGLYLVVNHGWRSLRAHLLPGRPASLAERSAGAVLTFLAVVVAWVFFRAPDVATAVRMLQAMCGANGFDWPAAGPAGHFMEPLSAAFPLLARLAPRFDSLWYPLVLLAVFLLPSSQRVLDSAPQGLGARLSGGRHWLESAAWGVALGTMTVAAMLTFTRVSEFLYFQF